MKIALFLLALLFVLCGFLILQPRLFSNAPPIDYYQGIPLYSNGADYTKSHGRYYHWSGYYYGQKWQCVEFIKRFLFLHKNHRMPNVMGHAIDFYNPQLCSGELNSERGMLQYKNGDIFSPQPDDLIVFKNPFPYGHVAIVIEVERNFLTFIQQNVGENTREKIAIEKIGNHYFIGSKSMELLGWLRVPEKN